MALTVAMAKAWAISSKLYCNNGIHPIITKCHFILIMFIQKRIVNAKVLYSPIDEIYKLYKN